MNANRHGITGSWYMVSRAKVNGVKVIKEVYVTRDLKRWE